MFQLLTLSKKKWIICHMSHIIDTNVLVYVIIPKFSRCNSLYRKMILPEIRVGCDEHQQLIKPTVETSCWALRLVLACVSMWVCAMRGAKSDAVTVDVFWVAYNMKTFVEVFLWNIWVGSMKVSSWLGDWANVKRERMGRGQSYLIVPLPRGLPCKVLRTDGKTHLSWIFWTLTNSWFHYNWLLVG